MENKSWPTAGIFIPTMNRVDFVIRQLGYYASVRCPHTIYIGDSSPPEKSQKIEQEIAKLGSTIKTRYFFLPNHDDWQAHYRLITEVKEKYICYSGDDDYQIPNSITKCVEWLETHPDYTSASGYGVSFRLQQSGPYGQLKKLADYPRWQIEESTGTERIKKFFNHYYVTHFSVNKTADLANHWRNDAGLQDRQFKTEILPTALPLIYGKSKILNCLGFVRQMHDRRSYLPNTFDWITQPNWPPSYALFEQAISRHLAQKDNLSPEEATKVIRQAFFQYLLRRFQKDEPMVEGKNKQSILRHARFALVKTFPFLKYLYRAHLKPRLTGKREMHFETLRVGSQYYHDFQPVMDSFTTRDEENIY